MTQPQPVDGGEAQDAPTGPYEVHARRVALLTAITLHGDRHIGMPEVALRVDEFEEAVRADLLHEVSDKAIETRDDDMAVDVEAERFFADFPAAKPYESFDTGFRRGIDYLRAALEGETR